MEKGGILFSKHWYAHWYAYTQKSVPVPLPLTCMHANASVLQMQLLYSSIQIGSLGKRIICNEFGRYDSSMNREAFIDFMYQSLFILFFMTFDAYSSTYDENLNKNGGPNIMN